MSSPNPHRPPHILVDDTYYFITSATFRKEPYFNTDRKKRLILAALKNAIKNYKCKLYAWVILDNHFHLLVKMEIGRLLPKFIASIEGKSAIELNKLEGLKGKKRWYQYWDRGIRDEADLWKHFNYIHHNCVKHGYSKKMEDYLFSSYKIYLGKHGIKWLDSCFELYPIVDFTPTGKDEF